MYVENESIGQYSYISVLVSYSVKFSDIYFWKK